jgi:glucose-1-phosphate adenylyltransferase
MTNDVAAVVLAGGQGKRMGVLCRHRPKSALRFAGDRRVIDFALSNCLHSKITHVAALIDYQRSFLSGYLRRWCLSTGDPEMKIDALEARSHYVGTADAVYQNAEYLQRAGVSTALVLAADHVYKMDYRPMIAFHEQMKADATVGVVSMPREKARRFGTVGVDASCKVTDFAEKTDRSCGVLVSMGIYVFNVDSLFGYLSRDAASPNSPHDFGYSILPRMVEGGRVFSFKFDDYWRDIGTIEAYYWANMEIARAAASFGLDGKWPVLTVRDPLPGPDVAPRASTYRSILSPGCSIEGYVENSIVGPGVRIEAHAVVRNSVLMDDVFVGERSVVQSCIIDEGMTIGECCEIGAKDRLACASNPIAILSVDSAPRSLRPYGREVGSNGRTASSGIIGAPARLDEPNAELKN